MLRQFHGTYKWIAHNTCPFFRIRVDSREEHITWKTYCVPISCIILHVGKPGHSFSISLCFVAFPFIIAIHFYIRRWGMEQTSVKEGSQKMMPSKAHNTFCTLEVFKNLTHLSVVNFCWCFLRFFRSISYWYIRINTKIMGIHIAEKTNGIVQIKWDVTHCLLPIEKRLTFFNVEKSVHFFILSLVLMNVEV